MKPFFLLSENIHNSSTLVEKYNANSADLKIELLHLIESRILHIMLFGAYNAGKSTLINALVGADVAKVNDIPTTDKVDHYQWDNGVVLLDTPGVNAPIAHENITEQQIKRCGVMLFVIREGDQDTKNLYARLFDMLERRKKVFIVLNHQLTTIEDKKISIEKIKSIIENLAVHYSVSKTALNNITILPMNIQTAYKAKLKASEELLAHSGYQDFYQAFTQWVFEQKQEMEFLNSLKSQVNDSWYNPVIQKANDINADSANKDSNKLKEEIAILENEKHLLDLRVQNYLSVEVNLLKQSVSQILQGDGNQATLDSQLQQVFTPLGKQVETWLNQQLGDINNRIIVPISYGKTINSTEIKSELVITDTLIDSASTLLKDKNNIKQALLLGRELKIPMLKGRWESTLGKWAGKAAIFVQIATSIYDMYRSNAAQEEQNRKNRQRSIEIHQAIEEICIVVVHEYSKATNHVITEAFSAQIKALSKTLADEKGSIKELNQELSQLSELKEKMLQITF
ncbi:MAG: hypothetical protein BWK73_44210 [Thiothrix lacustris]|uniref:G domain-containing protein n=1 Tax=Thiothrix lacustris TaxID=525917 RepID=A0A1Y1QBJ4_9GAMM|nr:MAG: hypothetical protein BWK73_44210 [Thiothrix lacustris]